MHKQRAFCGVGTLLGVLSCVPTSQACLWDRDTLAQEASGLPQNVMAAITGRFPRNPPLFYRMRIQRVSAQLGREPRNFNLYDDVAVAYDRMGRDREALQWIEKKRAVLPPLASVKNDPVLRAAWYRYYANVGTFRMHQWLHDGAKRQNLAPVKQAANEIRRAIHLNPSAHFGREKYQLKLMQWVAYHRKPSSTFKDYLGLDAYVEDARPSHREDGPLKQAGYPDALQGLSGLIMLGNAWESVDVFYALQIALGADGQSKPSYLASLRVQELIKQGKGSLAPGAKRGSALSQQIEKANKQASPDSVDDTPQSLQATYTRLRAEADAYQAARTAYLLPRLRAGQHPDTDKGFWRDWHEPTPLSLATPLSWNNWMERLGYGRAFALLAVLLLGGIVASILALRKLLRFAFQRWRLRGTAA